MFDTLHVPLYYEYSANVIKNGSGGRCHFTFWKIQCKTIFIQFFFSISTKKKYAKITVML